MRWVLLLGSAFAVLGCGARGATSGDAGTGRRSFDVVATVTLRPLDGADMLPVVNRFTLVLDVANGRMIAGGGGEARAVPITGDDGRTFHASTMFGVGVSGARCSGLLRMAYQTMDFTVAGGALSGHATGQGFFGSSDAAALPMAFEAVLDGVPDTTPPFLIVPAGATTDDPLTAFDVWVSEPLPSTALARLVGGDGAVAGLASEIIEGDEPLIARFSKPTLTLPPGTTFQALFSDDVTDLAGNAAPRGEVVRLASVGEAPLVPATGLASVYIGGKDAPAPADLAPTPKLVVRMTVPPGATKLSFSYRQLAFASKTDVGFVQLGSVGRAPGEAVPIPTASTFEPVSRGGQTFDESPVATMNVPLPDELGPELIVVIRADSTACRPPGAGSPGLLVDDVRLE